MPFHSLKLHAVTCCFLFFQAGLARASDPDRGIELEIKVDPRLGHFSEWLEYPSLLAISLQNVGLSVFPSGYLTITDARTLVWKARKGARFKSGIVRFLEKRENGFTYSMRVEWGPFAHILEMKGDVDISRLKDGICKIRMLVPGALLFGKTIQAMAQRKVQNYYRELMNRGWMEYMQQYKNKPVIPNAATLLFTDSFNKLNAREAYPAKPYEFDIHRIFLITTLCIWFGVGPLCIFTLYLWKRLQLALNPQGANGILNPETSAA